MRNFGLRISGFLCVTLCLLCVLCVTGFEELTQSFTEDHRLTQSYYS